MEKIDLPKIEIQMTDDLFVKLMVCEWEGMCVEQHVHAYDHITVFAKGAFRVWKDNKCLGDFHAPRGIVIPAGTKHMFASLEDDSLALCIHNIQKTGAAEVIPSKSVLEQAMEN